MIICAYCGEEKGDDQMGCCGENHWEEIKCPECDSESVIYGHGFTPDNLETYYNACEMCNHQWGHQ